MSTDLDRMFGALRHDADAIPLDRAVTARRRGDRRRRTRLIAASVAVACTIGAGVTGGGWLARGDAQPAPGGRDWVVRIEPRPLGSEIPSTGDDSTSTPTGTQAGLVPTTPTSGISGDRILLAWQDKKRVIVRLADLETGQPIGQPRAIGWHTRPSDDLEVVGLPWAFVAISRVIGVPTAYVIDPESGEVRWSRKFDLLPARLIYHPDALVAVGEDRAIRAFDWHTGAVLWEVPREGQFSPQILGMGTEGAPETDDRVLQFAPNNTLVVRDVHTGQELSRRSTGRGISLSFAQLVVDGRLYKPSPGEIWVTDVDGGAQPRRIHRRADSGMASILLPCGPGRICFLEGSHGDYVGDLVALDVNSEREVWRTQAPGRVESMRTAGTRVLVTTEEGTSALYDENGRQLLGPEDQRSSLVWLTDDSLLAFGRSELVEVAAIDGSRHVLGTSPDGEWRCTSWTTRRLVCRTDGGFRVWSIGS